MRRVQFVLCLSSGRIYAIDQAVNNLAAACKGAAKMPPGEWESRSLQRRPANDTEADML